MTNVTIQDAPQMGVMVSGGKLKESDVDRLKEYISELSKPKVGSIQSHNGVRVCAICERELRGEHVAVSGRYHRVHQLDIHDSMVMECSRLTVCPQNANCHTAACVQLSLEDA